MRLKREFFNRSAIIVAKELLGKYLCRRLKNKIVCFKITETEAYCGQRDLACHASKGLTSRTKIMFGPPGYAYVYLIYGMYNCLNVVTGKEGYPAAVLIRKVELQTLKPNTKNSNNYLRLDGPGKLCRALNIDRRYNGIDLCKSKEIWFEDRKERSVKIKSGKRIGVDYAGKWAHKLWRFYL
jgi:DNA-3-methyladenine glycosylase